MGHGVRICMLQPQAVIALPEGKPTPPLSCPQLGHSAPTALHCSKLPPYSGCLPSAVGRLCPVPLLKSGRGKGRGYAPAG